MLPSYTCGQVQLGPQGLSYRTQDPAVGSALTHPVEKFNVPGAKLLIVV